MATGRANSAEGSRFGLNWDQLGFNLGSVGFSWVRDLEEPSAEVFIFEQRPGFLLSPARVAPARVIYIAPRARGVTGRMDIVG